MDARACHQCYVVGLGLGTGAVICLYLMPGSLTYGMSQRSGSAQSIHEA